MDTFLLSVGSDDRLRDVADPMPAYVKDDVLHAVLRDRWTKFPLRVSAGTVIPYWVRDLLVNYTDYLVWSAVTLGQVVRDVQGFVDAAYPTYIYVHSVPGGYCLFGNYDQMRGAGVPRVGIMPPNGATRPTSPDTLIGDPRFVIGDAQDGVLAQDAVGAMDGQGDRQFTILTRYIAGRPVQVDRAVAGTQAVKAACKLAGI